MKNLLPAFWAFICFSCSGQLNTNKVVLNATVSFLNNLSAEQKKEAVFPLESEERTNWFYTPVPRKGLDYRKLNKEQKKLAMEILSASLSENGSSTAKSIMQLEGVLHVLENRPAGSDHRDPEKYYFSIFGEPSSDKPWAWRIEGHHLSLNYSSANGKISSATPLFFGTNPARVPANMPLQEGTEVLQKETQMGFDFLFSLTSEQKATARTSEKAPYDMVSSNNKMAEVNQSEGLSYEQMNSDQKEAFINILKYYIRRTPYGFATELLQKVEDVGFEQLRFVWMGAEKWGAGHYYRIAHPVILVEYDCTQNNANHVHTVVRDLTNDWGEDLIQRHIREDH